MEPDPDEGLTEEESRLARVFRENSRPWQSYWYWRDKPVAERGAAQTVLAGAGLEVERLRSRANGEDPPDCEAMIDGEQCGIEVTELLHRPTLEQSIQAIRAKQARREPVAPAAYFDWRQDDLLSALQGLIDRKDGAEPNGGPYDRYFLVIVTDEFFLNRFTVEAFLHGATFEADRITDALLGLSYHPSPEAGGGFCPVFKLPLVRRIARPACGTSDW